MIQGYFRKPVTAGLSRAKVRMKVLKSGVAAGELSVHQVAAHSPFQLPEVPFLQVLDYTAAQQTVGGDAGASGAVERGRRRPGSAALVPPRRDRPAVGRPGPASRP